MCCAPTWTIDCGELAQNARHLVDVVALDEYVADTAEGAQTRIYGAVDEAKLKECVSVVQQEKRQMPFCASEINRILLQVTFEVMH